VIATPTEVGIGLALDLAFGDPKWLPHPVRAIGWGIVQQERFWRRTPVPLRWSGVLLWLATVGGTAAVVAASMLWLPRPWIAAYWIYSFLAIRDLDAHAGAVVTELIRRDIPAARAQLAQIVGRDTADLDETEIMRGVVETVAENLGDAVVAPLFYLALGGPVAMAAYKSVNTLDSMVGYKNERYREFGWFSARADDWANWIPARIAAGLIWLVSVTPGYSLRRSIRITLRDGASQPSPNSGYPEAAAAGALGVRLGGLNHYGGQPSQKAYLGDATGRLDVAIYTRVRVMLYGVSLLAAAGACLR
jgi:adenosylcobinamide-phosphate synthase